MNTLQPLEFTPVLHFVWETDFLGTATHYLSSAIAVYERVMPNCSVLFLTLLVVNYTYNLGI